jgi:hypothetical protein
MGSGDDDHLPERLVRFHAAVGIGDLVERVNRIHDRAKRAGLERTSKIAAECVRRGCLFLDGSRPQHGADHRCAATQETPQIERRRGPGDQADQHEPPSDRQGVDAGRRVRTANQIQHDIEPVWGPIRRELSQSFGVVDRCTALESERKGAVDLVGCARRSERYGADSARYLDRSEPNAAADGVNKHPVARAHVGLCDECVVRSDECFGNRPHVGPWNVPRCCRDGDCRHGDELGMGATARDTENPVANRSARDISARLHDFPGVLEPGDVARRTRWSWVATLSLMDVGTVESGSSDTHEHVLRPDYGIDDLSDFQDLRTAGAGNDGGAHLVYGNRAGFARNRSTTGAVRRPRVLSAVIDEGVFVFALLAFALSTAAAIIGFTQAKDFVSRRLRYVDAARSPLAPLVAGAGAALVAMPIVWLLPFVTGVSAVAFGISVGLGVAAGNKEVRRSLPPG